MAGSRIVIRSRGRGRCELGQEDQCRGLHKYVRGSVSRFSAGAQTPTMLGDAGRWVVR